MLGRCSGGGSDEEYVSPAPGQAIGQLEGEAEPAESLEMYITASSVNCRTGAGTNFAKTNSFSYAEEIMVSETRPGWSKAELENCWVASKYLSEDIPEPIVQRPSYSAPSRFYETPDTSSPSCGSKWKCGQMNSCSEAYHYLNNCGLGRLDGDGDGVPCESIC